MEGQGSRLLRAQGADLRLLASIALIIVCSAAVYANSLSGDFVCDDRPMLLDNPKIEDPRFVVESFSQGVWKNSNLDYPDQFLYRPLFLVNLYLNHQAWGSNPAGYHAVNLLMHVGNTLLVFFLIRRIHASDRLLPALGAALLFAVHPVHVESVSWISGSTDLLATLFFLAAFLLYIRFRSDGKQAGLALSVLLFAMALLSKEVSVVFIMIAMVHDRISGRGIKLGALLPYVIVTGLYILARGAVLGRPAGILTFTPAAFLHIPQFMCAYISLLIAPWPLRFYFTLPQQGLVNALQAGLCIAAVTGMFLLAFRRRVFLFGVSWVFITLAPPLLLAFYRNPIIADRFLYLPSVGLAVIVAGLLQIATGRYRAASATVLASVIVLFSALTVRANGDWRNDEVFYGKACRTTPQHAGAYTGLGNAYNRRGDVEHAAASYLQALQFASGKERSDLYDLLGVLYGKKGMLEESIHYFELELNVDPRSSRALTGLGNDFLAKGDYQEALTHYHDAFQLNAANYEACYNLGLVYELTGERAKALSYYTLFIKNAPAARYAGMIGELQAKLVSWRADRVR